MGLFDFLSEIFSQGYDGIEDYCNQNGCEICDVVDDPDDYYDYDED